MYDLDLVEVLFKDQYFSRGDMGRMRNSMGACSKIMKLFTLWHPMHTFA